MKWPILAPGSEQHEPAQEGHQRGHREVGLQQDQEGHQPQHDEERQHSLLELTDLLALLGRQHRAPDDHGDARQLRRLKAHRAQLHPAPGAVDRTRDPLGERQHRDQQQHQRHQQQRPRQRPPPVVVLPRGQQEQHAAEQRSAELSHREVEPDVLAVHRRQARGAVGGGDAESEQQRGDRAQQAGLPAHLARVPDRRPLSHIASTACRKRAPRSS